MPRIEMPRILLLVTLSILFSHCTAFAREWTDATGHYKFKGEFVASGETMVILQRENKEKDLVAIDIDQLSKEDQAYLQKLTSEDSDNKEMRTYKTRNGLEVRAAVIRFISAKVEVYRHRGKVYVNGYRFDKLPGVYRKIVPAVVSYFEQTELDENGFLDWVKGLQGARKSYQCEGVLAELENGDHYAFPLFLLSDEDREWLQPGYEEWAINKDNQKTQEEYSMRMRAEAIATERKEKQQQQFAKLHLLLQGVQAGLTDLWEVALIPATARGLPRRVIVPGRSSREAAAMALSKFPGYRTGPVRQVSSRGF